jgi:hypothetical protein
MYSEVSDMVSVIEILEHDLNGGNLSLKPVLCFWVMQATLCWNIFLVAQRYWNPLTWKISSLNQAMSLFATPLQTQVGIAHHPRFLRAWGSQNCNFLIPGLRQIPRPWRPSTSIFEHGSVELLAWPTMLITSQRASTAQLVKTPVSMTSSPVKQKMQSSLLKISLLECLKVT